MENDLLLQQFDLLATAPGGVAKLRELILSLAVQGKLVSQDPADEPARELLKRIRAEKDRLIAEGKIKRDKPLTAITDDEQPFELPSGWVWSCLATIGVINPRNDAPDDTLASFVQMSSIPVEFSAAHVSELRPWKDIKSGFTQFAEGDVGVAKITPCFENGKSTVFQNLSNRIGAGTTELHIVRPLGGIERRYVLLYLKTPSFLKEGEAVMTGSAGQKRLPRSYFECKPFPLPPLAEQFRIVTRVEELMRVCDALEAKDQHQASHHRQLVQTLLGTLTDADLDPGSAKPTQYAWQRVAAHFDTLFDRPRAIDALEQTILQLAVRGQLVPQDPTDEPASELLKRIRTEKDRLIAEGKIKRDKPLVAIAEDERSFELPEGWEWVRVADICSIVTDGEHLTPERCDDPSAVPLVTAKNVRSEAMDYRQTDYVPHAVAEQCWKRCKPETGDILMVSVGATLGRLTVLREPIDMVLVRSVTVLRPVHVAVDVSYLALHLMAPATQIEIWANVKQSAQPCLYLAKSAALTVALPPLPEQARIVARVAHLRRLCAELRQHLTQSLNTQAALAEAMVSATDIHV
jgi:type I restriction enzyme S subunit